VSPLISLTDNRILLAENDLFTVVQCSQGVFGMYMQDQRLSAVHN